MDYEKKYKEALGWMQSLYNGLHGATKEDAEHYFPELKESEDERIKQDILAFIRREGQHIDKYKWHKWLAWLEKQGEKSVNKLQVSGKLYEHIRNTCACIDDALSSETLADINDYLSMAERSAQSAFDMIEKQVEQKPAEWSEEDENIKESIITGLEMLKDGASDKSLIALYNKKIEWLKSIRPQNTWKPSEHELEVLKLVAEKDGTCLMGLYKQLKKLMEE